MSENSHHIVPFKHYLAVLVFLLVMTVITVAVAQFDFGALNTPLAIFVATLKAAAVMAIFMHLKYDDKVNLLVFLLSVFFVVLMFAFCAADIFTRETIVLSF